MVRRAGSGTLRRTFLAGHPRIARKQTGVQCLRWHVVEWKDNPVDLMAASLGGGAEFAKDELVDVLRQFNTEEIDVDEIARTSIRATEPWGDPPSGQLGEN